MELLGSKTEQNLKKAFSGESEARNKYTYYASAARKEGYHQIAATFDEIADNEKEHAKLEFKLLGGLGDTLHNLANAALGEHYEWTEMYKHFEKDAREEGFTDIAILFSSLAKIEEEHEKRFQCLIDSIQKGEVFKREQAIRWHCRNCGHIHEGTDAPEICPTCKHPKGYFEQASEI